MISLGGIGTFYQLYKIIFPTFFNQSPLQDITNNGPTREFRDVFGMDSAALDLMIIFGVIGLLISVFYIIGGAKLLSEKPTNYHFAKYALLIFIIYNLVGAILFFSLSVGLFLRILLIYSLVGLVFDIALFVILLSSNIAAYWIGDVNQSQRVYTAGGADEEII